MGNANKRVNEKGARGCRGWVAHGWCCQGGWSQRGLSAFIRCRSIDKQRMQQCTPVTFMVPRTPSLSSIPPSTRFLSHPRTRQTNWKRKCAPPAGWPLRRPCGQHEEANWQIKFHSNWKPFLPLGIRNSKCTNTNTRILAQIELRGYVWGLWWQADGANIYNCSQ